MIQTLLRSNNYDGKFVAFKNFDDHSVVGEGLTPQEAAQKAQQKGCKDPVITFVPLKGVGFYQLKS
jgi:hypothetical protein